MNVRDSLEHNMPRQGEKGKGNENEIFQNFDHIFNFVIERTGVGGWLSPQMENIFQIVI